MPLLCDKSWEELQTYGGTNPRLENFDDFREKGLEEIGGIDLTTELNPSARTAVLLTPWTVALYQPSLRALNRAQFLQTRLRLRPFQPYPNGRWLH
jgi:hypothetical protein